MIPDTPVQEDFRPRAGIRALTVARQRWNHTSFPHDVGLQERYAHRHVTTPWLQYVGKADMHNGMHGHRFRIPGPAVAVGIES